MRILGIEFGSWSLKAVEMESRFRRMDILDFHEIRLPLEILNPTETYRKAVSQLLARLPSHPDKIVTSLPASHTAVRFLPIPIRQRKKVEKMFRFELQDTVPFQLDKSIVEHLLMTQKDGTVVFAAIAPEKYVQTHVEWLQSLGVDPDWLTFEGMGLINLYLHSLQLKPKASEEDPLESEPNLLLDIGHNKTNLFIVEKNRLEFYRSITWGGSSVTQSISLSLDVPLEEAERLKMNVLKFMEAEQKPSEESQEVMMAASQSLSPFLTDINHSLVAFRTLYKKKVSSVYITGGTSKIWGIDGFLSSALSVPVQAFDAFRHLHLKEELRNADECRFGEPVGRAMVFARKVPFLYNFRRQAAAKGTSLAELGTFLLSPNVQKLLVYIGVLMAILFVHVHSASQIAQKEKDNADQSISKIFQDTFPNAPGPLKKSLTSNPKELTKFIEQKNNETKQKLKMISKERIPMLFLIRDISLAFPNDVQVDINSLSLDDHTFTAEGVIFGGNLNLVTRNLKQIKAISKINLEEKGQRFTYTGEINGR